MIGFHAVYQHQYIIEKFKKIFSKDNLYFNFVESIPDHEFKKKIKTQIERYLK